MSKRKIDWLNHGLEFFVVIIGILLAFQLNKYAENRNNRNNVKVHIEQLKEETKLNSFFMKNGVKYSEIGLHKMDTLINLLESQKDFKTVDRLLVEFMEFNGVYIRKNAYHSLIESGDFRLMASMDEKQKIINLYEYYDWVESFSEDAFSKYNSEFYPFMQEHFDRSKGSFINKDFYKRPKLKNILYSYQTVLSRKVDKLKSCSTEMDKFLETIQG